MDEQSINATSSEAMGEQSFIARTSGLKAKDYLGYALGDIGCCLVFGLVNSLLQKFYTDIFHLNPLWIMIMMIAARLWDAINDPMMGRITDIIKPDKTGKYRRWLVWGSIPLAASSILMFAKFPGLGNTPDHIGTFIFATATYIMFGMAYTVVQIPYGSLANVITTDSGERSKLSTFRSVGAGLGGAPAMILASFCYADRVIGGVVQIGENGLPIQDMQYTPVIIGVSVLAIVSMLMLYVSFRSTKERLIVPAVPKRKKGEGKTVIKNLLTNKSFLSASLASMLFLAAQMFTQSYYLYLFADFFGKGWMNMVAVLCTYAPVAIFIAFIPKLIRNFGKKEVCVIGLALAAVANLLMFATKGLMPGAWWLFLILCFLSGVGQAFFMLQVWSFATDAMDDVEVKTGMREDGISYATFMFFRKVGQMIAAIAVNGALMIMGYKTYAGARQTYATLSSMYDLATIIPAVMFGLMAVILFFWYPLGKKKTQELQIAKEAIFKEKYDK